MKVCANPKCPFHFEAETEILKHGFVSFRPLQILNIFPVARESPFVAKVKTGFIKVHEYRMNNTKEIIYVCDICHTATQMFNPIGIYR